jgi:methionine-rich copper-binding protein CopC
MAARLALAGLIAFAALVSGRIPASAHSNFVGSDPADGSALGQSPEAGETPIIQQRRKGWFQSLFSWM